MFGDLFLASLVRPTFPFALFDATDPTIGSQSLTRCFRFPLPLR